MEEKEAKIVAAFKKGCAAHPERNVTVKAADLLALCAAIERLAAVPPPAPEPSDDPIVVE